MSTWKHVLENDVLMYFILNKHSPKSRFSHNNLKIQLWLIFFYLGWNGFNIRRNSDKWLNVNFHVIVWSLNFQQLAGQCKGHNCKSNEACMPREPAFYCVQLPIKLSESSTRKFNISLHMHLYTLIRWTKCFHSFKCFYPSHLLLGWNRIFLVFSQELISSF